MRRPRRLTNDHRGHAPGCGPFPKRISRMTKVPLTARGAEQLRTELEQLKKVERPRIIEAIAEARAHGDLKENAEYHAAREQQGFVEGRIKEIEGKLSNAQIIDVTQLPRTGKVVFGVTVEVLDVDKDEEHTYIIVGDDEADIKQGKISVSSPIARGLIGKEEGDVAIVDAPAGKRELEVLAVRYE
jgi:transcription elongation factor GreA